MPLRSLEEEEEELVMALLLFLCQPTTKEGSLHFPSPSSIMESHTVIMALMGNIHESDLDLPGLSPVDKAPLPRSCHTATTVGNKIFFFGGIRDGDALNNVHIFDTSVGRWIHPQVLGTPPVPRYGHSAVLMDSDRILIYGGEGVSTEDMIWFLEVDTPFVKQQRIVLGKEVVAWSQGVIGHSPQPVVVCGPSGVGKGTLIARLMKDFPQTFGFSVSHTTRSPRESERNAVHYHFTTRALMEREVKEGKFLEYADVHGNLYGTSIAAVEAVADAGKRCILDIDVQGAQAVKRSSLGALFIFIAPPSFEELERRLRGRGTESEEQIRKRLWNAKAELEKGNNTSLFNHILINGNLEDCYLQLKKLLGLETSFPAVTQNGSQHSEMEPLIGHSASMVGCQVYICGGRALSQGKDSNRILVLDTSSMSGGAPARTKGLKWLKLDAANHTDFLKP